MKLQSNNPILLFLIIGISIPVIIVGKMLYNQYTFSSDEGLRTQLIEKISKIENVMPNKIIIEKLEAFGKEKIKHVRVTYQFADNPIKMRTFRYEQAIFGRIVVGKEVK